MTATAVTVHANRCRRFGSLATSIGGLAALLLVLAGCRLTTDVGVSVHPDGSGSVVLRVVVDGEVTAAVPNLAGALQLHDAAAAGWAVSGPTGLDGGGLMVTLSNTFGTLTDANTLLTSFGPPFTALTLSRTQSETEVVTELAGVLSLPGGSFDAFADSELLAALGGGAFADELAASGATPASAMTVDLRVELPGRVVAHAGGRIEDDAMTTQEHSEVLVWRAPLDGSSTEISARAAFGNVAGGGGLPGWLGTVALIAAAAWLLAGAFIAWRMWQAQQRRARSARRRQYRSY